MVMRSFQRLATISLDLSDIQFIISTALMGKGRACPRNGLVIRYGILLRYYTLLFISINMLHLILNLDSCGFLGCALFISQHLE